MNGIGTKKPRLLISAGTSALLLFAWLCFGQGSLTPPGPPAPMMRTLEQIEPRTPISTLPFLIAQGGSYYLTTNLVGVVGQNGIIVSNDNVTLDLRGFAVISGGGFGSGIYVPNVQKNLSVRNGTLQGWGDYGIRANNADNCQYQDLNARDNGRGFVLGNHALVRNCIAHNNFYEGFLLGQDTTVINCSARSNGADGFNVGQGSQIQNSWAGGNADSGFGVGDHCAVKDCISFANANGGIQAGSGCRLVENTCNENWIGINATGQANRIDSNVAYSNLVAGIQVVSNSCNVIVRNHAGFNGSRSDYLGLSDNIYGPLTDCGSGIITSGSGWANFYQIGTDVYAGGAFTTAGGTAANRIAKCNGSAWTALGLGMDASVLGLAVSGSNLYAGGRFTSAGGNAASYVAKWDGSAWTALGSGMNGYVLALAASGSDLYAGGYFTAAGTAAANHIAKWNGSTWTALGSGIDGSVYALAVSGNDLYAGGYFLTAGGNPANSVAKWNGSGWSALGSGVGGGSPYPHVYALAVSGGDVYAGGQFTTAGGGTANYIAKWNGSAWTALDSGMNDVVNALAVVGGDLYAGGVFTTAGGDAANYIAKWNGNSWTALGSEIDFWVNALAVWRGDLYAGGNFSFVAKWNGSSWTTLGSGVTSSVFALAVSGGGL